MSVPRMTPRIAIAGFQHETNTFAPLPTRLEDFKSPGAWPALTRGAEVIEVFAELNIPIGGFIQAAKDWDLVPILWTNAEPGGYVSQAAFDEIAEMICGGVQEAGDLDGVYLDLHGAMVTEDFEDGEGELLRRLREVTGPDLPIAVSLDLHTNLTHACAERASSLAIYRTYPHIDMAETGARAQALLAEELARGAPFAKAYRQLAYLIPLPAQSTLREPGRRIYGLLPGSRRRGRLLGRSRSWISARRYPRLRCRSGRLRHGPGRRRRRRPMRCFAELQASEDQFRNPLLPAEEAVRKAMGRASPQALQNRW